MRIALDAMGGDHGVRPNVAGALRAVAAVPDLHVILVGDPAQIDTHLAGQSSERIEIVPSAGVIGMDEKPVEALRKKPENSISRCWQLTAKKLTDGLVSAGNTGAVVGAGLFARRFLKGVRRPGIGTLMPTETGHCVVLDVGANIFPKPSHLVQYGVMGSVLAKQRLGIDRPKIGLMNVGEEEGKGHELVQKTYALFRNSPFADRFVGNVEGRDVHKGVVDVIVTDGFVGNVLLKHAEGVFEFIMKLVARDVVGVLGAERALAGQALSKLIDKFHYSAAGGAPLLGIDGVCIICHGSSDERAIANALAAAAQDVREKLNDHIVEELAGLPMLADDE